MRVVVQRTKEASVTVGGQVIGRIPSGFMLLVGITHEDTKEKASFLAEKIVNLRVFEDENEKMNLSLVDVEGQILSVSQFTLYGDCSKGRRPSFAGAAKPDFAKELYDFFNEEIRAKGIHVETGEFGAMMDVALINDGPVTLIVER